jgi:GNAT superfamily N-acetyltransferase
VTDFERAVAFEEERRERCAERVVPFRFGRAVFNDTFHEVWDLNLLRAFDLAGATIGALVAEAERLQGMAGHAHRRIAVFDQEAGVRLEPEFRTAGWELERSLFMAWQGGDVSSAGAVAVKEVDAAALRPLRLERTRAEPWAESEELVRQAVESGELIARMGNARHFAALVDGQVVSGIDLYSDGRTAQAEDLSTRPAFRGRGLGTALLLRSVQDALATGHDFVFLVADDTDWPKDLYVRLGFRPLGRTWAFLRKPVQASPA